MMRTVLGALTLGALAAYLLDPDRGRRRRALVRDQLVSAAHRTGDAVETTSRDVTNRARGAVAELRSAFNRGDVSDTVLKERVRARIGAVVGRSASVEAAVEDGRVALTGPILAADVDRLLRRVRAVPGVREIENRLEVHAEPGNVPGLQGRPRPSRGGEVFELWQRNWSPSARFFTGLVGSAMALRGLRRFDALGIVLAAAGFTILARAVANMPIASLTSLEHGEPSARQG